MCVFDEAVILDCVTVEVDPAVVDDLSVVRLDGNQEQQVLIQILVKAEICTVVMSDAILFKRAYYRYGLELVKERDVGVVQNESSRGKPSVSRQRRTWRSSLGRPGECNELAYVLYRAAVPRSW